MLHIWDGEAPKTLNQVFKWSSDQIITSEISVHEVTVFTMCVLQVRTFEDGD